MAERERELQTGEEKREKRPNAHTIITRVQYELGIERERERVAGAVVGERREKREYRRESGTS